MDMYINRNLIIPETKDICIFSYNSRGFHDGNQSICKDLLTLAGNKIPIICNQENFMLKGNKYKIEQCLPDHQIYFKPATKEGLNGRPKNGMFVAIPKYLKAHVTDISPSSSRVQAVILKTTHRNILILNTYFPQDPKTDIFDTTDLLTTLICIQNTIKENNFTELIWTGDINADFSRKTTFVDTVGNFVNESNLSRSWDRFVVDFTHENCVGDKSHTSVIDHFFWNEYLDTHVLDAGVLHIPGNLSDHSPIYCVLQNNENLTRNDNIKIPEPKPCWKNATEKERDDFFEEINRKLRCLEEPIEIINCLNVHCNNAYHKTASDDYMLEILHTMEQAAKKILPTPKIPKKDGNSSKSIPRWNEDIEPYRKDALFWHSVWVSAGKPLNNELHNIMKRTKNIYHFHIRKKQKNA